jgi:tetratricopeptide (TPR) repeat protein
MASLINWSNIVLVSILFLYTPFLRGLFFDSDLYLIESILAGLFVANAAWLLFSNKERGGLLFLIVFIIPFSHLISLSVAETPQGALDNLFRWLAYASMFAILIWTRQRDDVQKIDKVLILVFQLTGIWISFFALFGLWGWVDFKDIMLADRMTGPFQYPNTFAAVISAFWLFTLVNLTRRDLPIWLAKLYSFPLVAYGVGLLHSYSRGAMLVFPIAWLAGLLLLKWKEQIFYIFLSFVSVIASMLVFRQITVQAEQDVSNPGLTAFVIATAAVVVITMLIRYLRNKSGSASILDKWESRGYARYLLPGVFVVLGLFGVLDIKNQGIVYQLLPQNLQTRLADINLETASLLGRTNVYEDAFRISKDSPILGLGGDGWRVVYQHYQEVPYLNNEVHNGYLEVLLSNGWLGVTIFAVVFGYLFTQVFRRLKNEGEKDQTFTKAALTALAMIFLHAAIDFDFSYGTVWLMVFWLFAIAVPTKSITSSWFSAKIPYIGSKSLVAVVAAFALVTCVYTSRFYLAVESLVDGTEKETLAEAQSRFEKAVAYNPYNTNYLLGLADVYAKNFAIMNAEQWKLKAIEYAELAEKREPHNPKVLFGIGNVYLTLNDVDHSFEYFGRALKYDRFFTEVYDAFIQVKSQVAVQLKQSGNKEQAAQFAKEAVGYFQEYRERFEPFKAKNIPDKRPLELNNNTYFYIGQAHMLLGQYAQAIETLKAVNDPKQAVEAQALMVVAHEAMGQAQQAAAITKAMIAQYTDFPQRVVGYRAVLTK